MLINTASPLLCLILQTYNKSIKEVFSLITKVSIALDTIIL